MAIELTHENLFNQVWDRPMTKVAADYGISDVGLKKICTKHRIPVPGRGYWAKKAAGKTVERTHFRTVSEPTVNRIVIYGSPAQNLPEAVKEAMQAARKREQRPENKVDVIAAPIELHPKVARTQKKLEKAKPSKTGLVAASGPDLFELEIGQESVERAVAFLNALVTAAEARTYRVIKDKQALVFLVDDEFLEFKIVEETKRSKHAPTEAEVGAIEKWEKRQRQRLRSWDRGDWTPWPQPPKWDYEPIGRLRVLINEGCYAHQGIRRTFGDGKTQRIETLINAILEAFATWSAAIKTKRIENKRRKREREEAERQREAQRRRNALESKRVEALSTNLEQWAQRQQILEYVAVVEAKLNSGEHEDREAVREWIDWAKGYAQRIDPLSVGLPRLLRFEDSGPWKLRY